VTRIVAGLAKGRRLEVPAKGTRPTSDRAREALFSSVTSRLGTLEGCAVLDLYAGSGALGLEALSRGAKSVDLVEADRQAVAVLRRNVETVRLSGARVHAATVERWLVPGRLETAAGLVLIDPPYALTHAQVAAVLDQVADCGLLGEGALVVLERAFRDGPFDWPRRFTAELDRRYGEAALWFACFDSVAAC
jgi:16S rRNA (guanine966-N2)-methyltransferase